MAHKLTSILTIFAILFMTSMSGSISSEEWPQIPNNTIEEPPPMYIEYDYERVSTYTYMWKVNDTTTGKQYLVMCRLGDGNEGLAMAPIN